MSAPSRAAALVILAGISAALHVGKLPPAIPVLRDALGVTLMEAGFLLSLVQLAGMTLGLLTGLAADAIGLKRMIVTGLIVLSVASALGAEATSPAGLLVLRACEGFGFLLASLPAPALIRRLITGSELPRMLGWWGAYMPIGTASALLVGPAVMAGAGWPWWWRALALVSLAMAAWLALALPASLDRPVAAAAAQAVPPWRRTLRAPGPWLAAIAFAFYSAQWLAVIGFLPSIYAQAGLPAAGAAVATALAAGSNAAGNIASGRLLGRGWRAPSLLWIGYGAMALGALLAFAPAAGDGAGLLPFIGVLLFSSVGGLIPGTLFALAVRLAPDDATVSTTVGWMQQWSSFGQFAGPPAVAWVAARAGWGATWWVTVAFAACGGLVTWRVAAALRREAISTVRADT